MFKRRIKPDPAPWPMPDRRGRGLLIQDMVDKARLDLKRKPAYQEWERLYGNRPITRESIPVAKDPDRKLSVQSSYRYETGLWGSYWKTTTLRLSGSAIRVFASWKRIIRRNHLPR